MLRKNERKLTAAEVKGLPDGTPVRVYGRDRRGYTTELLCDVVTEGRAKRLRYFDMSAMAVKRMPIHQLDGAVHFYTVEDHEDA